MKAASRETTLIYLSTLKAVDDLHYCDDRCRYRQDQYYYFKTHGPPFLYGRVKLSLDEGDPAAPEYDRRKSRASSLFRPLYCCCQAR